MQIYILDISPLFEEAMYQSFYAKATAIRRRKADELKQPEDKARCIGAGVLLQKAYELYKGINDGELASANSLDACGEGGPADVCVAANGKPYFEGEGRSQPYFNLSHSGIYAICAMSASCEMGIDIQRKRKKMDAVVKRVFSAQEQKSLEDLSGAEDERKQDEESSKRFTEIWTQKEARAKLGGEGIKMLLENRETDGRSETHWIAQEYAWSVAWRGEDRIEGVVILEKQEVFSC